MFPEHSAQCTVHRLHSSLQERRPQLQRDCSLKSLTFCLQQSPPENRTFTLQQNKIYCYVSAMTVVTRTRHTVALYVLYCTVPMSDLKGTRDGPFIELRQRRASEVETVVVLVSR